VEIQDLIERVRALVASQRLAVLATQEEGQPYTSLVAFVETDDLRHMIFATARETRKFTNIVRDPRVAMLVDDRSNDEADFRRAVAVTAIGRASEVRGQDRNGLAARYLRKHPYLEEFVTSPSCALMKVTVERYYVVSEFQNVAELWLS
jgi:nitroimidazol reductase NimA-like FMN-containing flavoprotein (pyridoxamine 5'-phosphate oxidase superfamily)